MEHERLNKLFDEAIGRIKKDEAKEDSYGLGPLASDHLILKKSWSYFNKRVKGIEDQFRDIFHTKENNIKALQKSLELAKEQNEKLKERLNDKTNYEDFLTEARLRDQYEFRDKSSHLRQTWGEERIRLEEMIRQLQGELDLAKKELKEVNQPLLDREKSLLGQLQRMQERIEQQGIKSQETETTLLAKQKELDDVCAGQQQKIDLMRKEIEARTDRIQSLLMDKSHLKKQIVSQNTDLLELREKNGEQAKKIAHLKDTIDLLTREKQNIQAAWEKEQAQWRELWDRERKLWDEKKNS